jgi:hypothetical protein
MTNQDLLPKLGDTFKAFRNGATGWVGTIVSIEPITEELVDVEVRWAKHGVYHQKEWYTDIASTHDLVAEIWTNSEAKVS